MQDHIILPKKPILVKQESETRSIYSIEPLSPGYGITIANSLRRVMLASLPGAAITSLKIKGVNHEFSTIPSVLEDAIEIILNLKQIRFKMVGDEPVILTVKAAGERSITAKDIKTTSDIEVLNPEVHIMTLTDKKASLDMELTVSKGVGYVKLDEKGLDSGVGVIAVDAIYSPIKRVSYEVEDMRVGDKTNFNRILFDITTDGSMTPLEAISSSAQVLVDHFSMLVEELGSEKDTTKKSSKKAKEVSELESEEFEPSSVSISSLDFSQKLAKALEAHGMKTLADLAQLSKETILEIKGVTAKDGETISKKLLQFGITL